MELRETTQRDAGNDPAWLVGKNRGDAKLGMVQFKIILVRARKEFDDWPEYPDHNATLALLDTKINAFLYTSLGRGD